MPLSLRAFDRSLKQAAAQRSRAVRILRGLGLLYGLLALGGCDAAPSGTSSGAITPAAQAAITQSEESRMWMTVGERRFAFTLADIEAARAFAAMLPLTINMPDLNSNEKHAQLPRALPANERRPGLIRNGDLMLYGSQTLVVFYQTFPSAYSYTRLGRVDAPDGLAQALGSGSARITFSKN